LNVKRSCTGKNSVMVQEPRKCIQCTSPGDGQTSCKVWLASDERHRCSNEAKTRNPLKFAVVPQNPKPLSALVGRSSPYCEGMWRRYCCLTAFLDPITELRGRFAAENFGEGGKVVEERKGREAKEGKGRAIPPNRNPGYGPGCSVYRSERNNMHP